MQNYKNLSPVTGADGIFWSQRGLFTETVDQELEISIYTGY